jgi:hypothetical protein
MRRVPIVKQELLTIPKHRNSRAVFCWIRSCCPIFSFLCSVLWTIARAFNRISKVIELVFVIFDRSCFLHIPIANKGIDAINIRNILNRKDPIDVLRFSEFRTMRNHLSETLMLNDIQITRCYHFCGQGFQQYRVCT